MKEKITFRNGIQLICDANSSVHSVAISVFFKTGTFYECKSNYGITHLVEHMFFRQCNGLTNEEIYFQTESIGSELRARTFRDCVCFEISVTPSLFSKAIDLLLNIFSDFSWTESELSAEKKVIKKQMEFYYQSYSEYLESIYFNHEKYAVPIMGKYDEISILSIDDINQWKQKYFNCSNACIVITGAFSVYDIKYTKGKLESIRASKHQIPKTKIIKPKGIFQRDFKSDYILPTSSNLADVAFFFDFDTSNVNTDIVEMVSTLLGGRVGSKLPVLLTDQYALTDLVTSTTFLYNGFGRVTIEYSVLSKDLIRSMRLVIEQLQRIKSFISINDVRKVLPFFRENREKELDDPVNLSFNYGLYDFVLCTPYELAPVYLKPAEAVIAMQNTANEVFIPSNMKIYVQNNSQITRRKDIKALCSLIRSDLAQ